MRLPQNRWRAAIIALPTLLLVAHSTPVSLGRDSQFSAIPIAGAADEARRLAFVDIDRDGDDDIVAAGEQPGLRWWENVSGDGATWNSHVIEGSASSLVLGIADIDRDGDEDIVGGFAQGLVWWENANGDGSAWTRHTIRANYEFLSHLAIGDVNKDGAPDVLTVDDDDVDWFANPGATGEEWTKQTIDPGSNGNIPWTVTTADLDGDGDLDALVSSSAEHLTWWENNGLSWAPHVIPSFPDAQEPAIVDMDEDGDLDIVSGDDDEDGVNTLVWLENTTGDASGWQLHEVREGPDDFLDFDTADILQSTDFDLDGDPDIVAGELSEGVVAWWENTGDAQRWRMHPIDNDFEEPTDIVMGDPDGDGDLDPAATSREGDGILWWQNPRRAHGIAYPEESRNPIQDPALNQGAVAHADVDGDGDVDVLTTNEGDDDVGWLENVNGDGSAWLNHSLDNNFDLPLDVIGTDLDSDGDTDIVAVSQTEHHLRWWENSGSPVPTWTERRIPLTDNPTVPVRAREVAAGDVDGDGDNDLVYVSETGETFEFIENLDGKGLTWAFPIAIDGGSEQPRSVSLVDMDLDGDLDVLGVSNGDCFVAWWENRQGLDWHEHRINFLEDLILLEAHAADVDRDGDPDVLVLTRDSIAWWINDSGDALAWTRRPDVHREIDSLLSVRPFDLDRDGDVDVFGSREDGATWWENVSGDGSQWCPAPIDPEFDLDGFRAFDIADLDGNGSPDIYGLTWDDLLGFWSPQQANPFAIRSVSRVGESEFILAWTSQPGCFYTVESSADLAAWARVEGSIGIKAVAAETIATVTLPPTDAVYLRVVRSGPASE